ncbi:MAG: polysaccharide biosynthesis protein [bacterium]
MPFGLKPTRTIRTAVYLVGDIAIWIGALFGAFLLRFDGTIPPVHLSRMPYYLLLFVPIKLFWHQRYRVYNVSWRQVMLTDLINVWKANTLGSVCVVAALTFLDAVATFGLTTRSVLAIDYLLSIGGITLFHFGRRLWDFQRHGLRRYRQRPARRVLLVGAGAAGERLARTMLDDPAEVYRPVGFMDDDPGKEGTYLHGLRVFGGRGLTPDVVRSQHVDEVVIAIPSASPEELRGIIAEVRQSDVQHIRILPGVHELLSARPHLSDIREVNLEDLLGRPPVRIDRDAITAFLRGKRVLVTGAAGSIGSELVRQLVRFPCAEVLALDFNESGLFEGEGGGWGAKTDVPVRAIIADIRDREKIDWLLRDLSPQVIFHAAAYKHVPLMERHTEEAVKTNVLGTFNVAEAAVRAGAEVFVLISTDKAVHPNNVMGATKRVAERIGQALSQRGRTRFLAVRFGNVLGSRGSLIPIIQEQIRRGEAVTLTHPDMRRFFMSIAEAVLLVLEAALADRQTGIFTLDMGESIKVMDLVQELIRLSGLEADRDIPVVFTGVRPGEKIEEELVETDEVLLPTRFEKIFEIKTDGPPHEMTLRLGLQELERLARAVDPEGIRALLSHLATNGGTTLEAASST